MENKANVDGNCFHSIVEMMILAPDRDDGQNWNDVRVTLLQKTRSMTLLFRGITLALEAKIE